VLFLIKNLYYKWKKERMVSREREGAKKRMQQERKRIMRRSERKNAMRGSGKEKYE